MAALVVALPTGFPSQQSNRGHAYRRATTLLFKETFAKVDFLGAGLLLLATTLLVASLEEAGQYFLGSPLS